MSLLLPWIGVTVCSRAIILVEQYPDNIAGTFWVMNGYGFGNEIPGWWVDLVLEENQAQAILDVHERGAFSREHDGPLYLGFCIIVTVDRHNPANFSYVIQHLRMTEGEGVSLLRALAKHNIPAITEVSYPMDFLQERYGYEQTPDVLKDLRRWNAQIWEDYCSYLMANHGQKMTQSYWANSRQQTVSHICISQNFAKIDHVSAWENFAGSIEMSDHNGVIAKLSIEESE